MSSTVTTLSEYQKTILSRIAQGQRVNSIARCLSANENTVRTHIYDAIKKLGAKTTAHAIAIAIKQNLI